MGETGCRKYKDIFAKYPWPQKLATMICDMESGGVANASNWKDSHETCNGSFGLMQIGCIHGYTRDELYDPETNIHAAYLLWKDNGFQPWSTYNKLVALNK